MKKALLIFTFFLSLGTIYAQKVNGVWFAGCNLKIDKYAGVDEYKVDSIYGIEGSVIDFISKDKFIIKAVGEKERQGQYTKSGDTLHLSVDEYQWKAYLQNEELTLRLIDSTDYSLELYYKKMKPSKIPKHKLLNTENILNSNWVITYDSGYSVFNFKEKDSLDNIGKPRAFISDFSEMRVATEFGNYLIDSYKNHVFLYVLGRTTLSEKIIHLSDYKSGMFSGFLYDCMEALHTPIPVEKVQLEQQNSLSVEKLEEERLQLMGRYNLKLLNFDNPESSESVKTIISYVELQENTNCLIEAYITENINDVAVLRKLEMNGVWKFDNSGQFVEVVFEDGLNGLICYFTIKKDETQTELFLNRNPWPEESELNTVLKFKKQ